MIFRVRFWKAWKTAACKQMTKLRGAQRDELFSCTTITIKAIVERYDTRFWIANKVANSIQIMKISLRVSI